MFMQEAIKLLRLQLHSQNFQVVQDRLPMVWIGLVRLRKLRLSRFRHGLECRSLACEKLISKGLNTVREKNYQLDKRYQKT